MAISRPVQHRSRGTPLLSGPPTSGSHIAGSSLLTMPSVIMKGFQGLVNGGSCGIIRMLSTVAEVFPFEIQSTPRTSQKVVHLRCGYTANSTIGLFRSPSAPPPAGNRYVPGLPARLPNRFEHPLRCKGQVGNADADRVGDGVSDRRGGGGDGDLGGPFGAIGAFRVDRLH